MSHPLSEVPGVLWRCIAEARHRLLMLDYDGTLAPFQVVREEARPMDGVVELLTAIRERARTTVAIISGRPVLELGALLGPIPATLIGEHGWERRLPGGAVVPYPLSAAVEGRLAAAERAARAEGFAPLLERKRTGLVLHTRGLDVERAARLEVRCLGLWSRVAAAPDVRLAHTNGGVELRAADRHKGTAALSLVSQAGPGTLPVYVGDDETDEDAFMALQDQGFGIRVGGPVEQTRALGWLSGCQAVRAFLEEWLRVTVDAAARLTGECDG